MDSVFRMAFVVLALIADLCIQTTGSTAEKQCHQYHCTNRFLAKITDVDRKKAKLEKTVTDLYEIVYSLKAELEKNEDRIAKLEKQNEVQQPDIREPKNELLQLQDVVNKSCQSPTSIVKSHKDRITNLEIKNRNLNETTQIQMEMIHANQDLLIRLKGDINGLNRTVQNEMTSMQFHRDEITALEERSELINRTFLDHEARIGVVEKSIDLMEQRELKAFQFESTTNELLTEVDIQRKQLDILEKQTEKVNQTLRNTIIPVVAFSVYRSGYIILLEGQILVFNKVRLNTNDVYNPVSGKFTAPVEGHYLFSSTVLSSLGMQARLHIVKNNKQTIGTFTTGTGTGYNSGSEAVVVNLEKGDEICVKEWMGYTGYVHGTAETSFMGILLNTN